MTRMLVPTLIAVLSAAAVHAQSALTGKWQGKTPNGFQIVLDVTATADALTGTLTRDGEATALTDGKVSGTSFTFKATLNEREEAFTGKLAGDEITVWLDRQGPERGVVLKRIEN